MEAQQNWSTRFGFHDKTLWHWLQLFLIPCMIGVFTLVITFQQRQTNDFQRQNHLDNLRLAQFQHEQEQKLIFDQWNETLLREYIKEMSEILQTDSIETRTSKLIRVKTLIVLRQLDAKRKLFVIQYLLECGLIGRRQRFPIDLKGADLSSIDFTRLTSLIPNNEPLSLYLPYVNLLNSSFANLNLRGANFTYTDVSYVQFSQAQLQSADFKYCLSFYQTDFSRANLTDALVDDMDKLSNVSSLHETTLPNGNHLMQCATNMDTISSNINGWTKTDDDGLSLIDYFFLINHIINGDKHRFAESGPVGDETGQGQCAFWGDYCQLIFIFLNQFGKLIGQPLTLGGPPKNENTTMWNIQGEEHDFADGNSSLMKEIIVVKLELIIRKKIFIINIISDFVVGFFLK